MVNSSYDIYIITSENFSLVLSQELQAFDFNPRISQLFSHGKNWYHLFATNFTGCFTGISWSLKFHIFFHRAKIIHFLPKDIIPEFTAYFTWQKYFTWVSQGLHMHFTGLLPVVSVVNNFPMNEQTFRERMLDMLDRCGSSHAVGRQLTDVTSLSNVPREVLSHLKNATFLKTFILLC